MLHGPLICGGARPGNLEGRLWVEVGRVQDRPTTGGHGIMGGGAGLSEFLENVVLKSSRILLRNDRLDVHTRLLKVRERVEKNRMKWVDE